ncbi:MAG TPA: hypothetical protein VHG52_06310, partial [Thermomicrobiales bacterium]|nr:hypothetical protein [Thermomicrobiales bacterium]
MTPPAITILVGTTKGAFLVSGGSGRGGWTSPGRTATAGRSTHRRGRRHRNDLGRRRRRVARRRRLALGGRRRE